MESQNFNDYKIADISDHDKTRISELESSMNTDSDKEVVLIAYQSGKAKE